MVQITFPPYLQDNFHRLFIVCNVEEKLSFLDPQCIDKLTTCLNEPTNELFKKVWDLFFTTFHVGLFSQSTNVPPYGKGEFLSIYNDFPPKTMDTYQQTLPFFMNPIKQWDNLNPKDDRLTNVGTYFHTFKCSPHNFIDAKELLNEQISWCVENGDGDCVIKKIYAHLAYNYEDFRALHCTYSGNKSVHIHTQWDIKHLSPMICSDRSRAVPDNKLRVGFEYFWDILEREIAEIINKHRNIDVKFDPSLKVPDSYRRLSWGLRQVERDGEFFDVGEKVPQIELFTKTRKRQLIYFGLSRLHKPRRFLISGNASQ